MWYKLIKYPNKPAVCVGHAPAIDHNYVAVSPPDKWAKFFIAYLNPEYTTYNGSDLLSLMIYYNISGAMGVVTWSTEHLSECLIQWYTSYACDSFCETGLLENGEVVFSS